MALFREITKDDREFFLESVKDFYNSPAVIHPVPEENFHNTFNDLMSESPYEKCFIFEHGGEKAGYGLVSLTWSNEAGGLVVLIEEIYVKEAFRGQGIGSAFLEFLEGAFKDTKRFRLEVERDNLDAVRLYERCGFSELSYMQMIKEK